MAQTGGQNRASSAAPTDASQDSCFRRWRISAPRRRAASGRPESPRRHTNPTPCLLGASRAAQARIRHCSRRPRPAAGTDRTGRRYVPQRPGGPGSHACRRDRGHRNCTTELRFASCSDPAASAPRLRAAAHASTPRHDRRANIPTAVRPRARPCLGTAAVFGGHGRLGCRSRLPAGDTETTGAKPDSRAPGGGEP